MQAKATETAVFGGGCFWCIEAVFQDLIGVLEVESGYCGGHVKNPTYEQVCAKHTGHVEVVRVRFDPAQVSFDKLLEIFFAVHDPTTRDRQGNDVGPQYRSAIFCQTPEQLEAAAAMIERLEASGEFAAPIVTALEAAATFYPAEDYHRSYYRLHGHQPYCSAVIAPKLAKFRRKFASYLRLHVQPEADKDGLRPSRGPG
jgi:peptide-methionine (S)-S-oxide reductase